MTEESRESYMYWRRNLEALLIQLATLIGLAFFYRNVWAAVIALILMSFAVLHATTRVGEKRGWVVETAVFLVTNRLTLALLAGIYWLVQEVWAIRRKG